MSIKITQINYTLIPEGDYFATLLDINEETGNYGPQLRFKFQLEPFQGFGYGKCITDCTGKKFSPNTKLYVWVSAMLGKLSADYEFDSGDLIDRTVLIKVKNRIGSDGITIFDQIESIKLGPQKITKTDEQIHTELSKLESKIPEEHEKAVGCPQANDSHGH